MKIKNTIVMIALAGCLAATRLAAQTVEQATIVKLTSYVQTSASAPFVNPTPADANYGGPYQFSAEVNGTGISGITPPVVTLAAGSLYPSQNPTRHNGGVLTFGTDAWNYGVDANNFGAPTEGIRDGAFADGVYGLTVMGTSLSLNLATTAFPANTPAVTLTGGTWARGIYYINVTQPLGITTNAFTNFNQNDDGVMTLNVNDVANQFVMYSSTPGSNFLTATIPANTLPAGQSLRGNVGFYALSDKSTALAGSLNAAASGRETSFDIVAYSGPLPSATLHGVGDLSGGINFSAIRAATHVNNVIFAVGGSVANAGSAGSDNAVLWSSTGNLSRIPNFVDASTAAGGIQGNAITPSASFIAATLRAGPGLQHAARVTVGGTALDLGTLPGFPQFSTATSISNDGSILYGVARYATGKNRAVRFTSAGPTITALPFLNGTDDASFTAQQGASANGLVVVGTSTNTATDGGDFFGPGNRAFRYVYDPVTPANSTISAIPLLPGGTWSSALSITPNGTIALVEGDSTSAPNGELYTYNASTQEQISLGTPNGSRRPFGFAGISGNGAVVAVTFTPADNAVAASYIHNAQGWHNLTTLATRAGVDLSGWTFETILGLSADGTMVWGRGMHNGVSEGYVLEFSPGYLATAAEPIPFSTPPSEIVGAWTVGDSTNSEGATVLVFNPNGYYVHIQCTGPADLPYGTTGYERGQYTWNSSTGAFNSWTLSDTNGDVGLSGSEGSPMTVTISGNTMTVNGSITATRVTGSNRLVGPWGSATTADASDTAVFLPNGRYFLMTERDSTAAGDPSGQDGIEWGTYTWNSATGAFTANVLRDTNGAWGFSDPFVNFAITASSDGLSFDLTDGPAAPITVPRVGTAGPVGAAVKPWADLNGDGKADLVWRNAGSNDYAAWLMNGTAIADSSSYGLPAVWQIIKVADFNGDGKSDLVWRNSSTGAVVLWQMNGTTISTSTWLYDSGTDWTAEVFADFNGDGKTDVLWHNTVNGEYAFWLMNGGTVSSASGFSIAAGWSVAKAADFNGDGKTDLLWRNAATGGVVLWTVDGTTIASSAWVYDSGTDWAFQLFADFNGDGKTDILWHNTVTGQYAFWLMNGSAVAGASGFTIAAGWEVTHAADFSGDGKADLIWRNSTSGGMVMWLQDGTATTSTGWIYDSGTDWEIKATKDFDGDGKADILWHNTVSGDYAFWLMNGATTTSASGFSLPAGWALDQ